MRRGSIIVVGHTAGHYFLVVSSDNDRNEFQDSSQIQRLRNNVLLVFEFLRATYCVFLVFYPWNRELFSECYLLRACTLKKQREMSLCGPIKSVDGFFKRRARIAFASAAMVDCMRFGGKFKFCFIFLEFVFCGLGVMGNVI